MRDVTLKFSLKKKGPLEFEDTLTLQYARTLLGQRRSSAMSKEVGPSNTGVDSKILGHPSAKRSGYHFPVPFISYFEPQQTKRLWQSNTMSIFEAGNPAEHRERGSHWSSSDCSLAMMSKLSTCGAPGD